MLFNNLICHNLAAFIKIKSHRRNHSVSRPVYWLKSSQNPWLTQAQKQTTEKV